MSQTKLPSNGSSDTVEGVIHCPCGEVATVHRPQGERREYLYTICPQCGTNQPGYPIQGSIRRGMRKSVAELPRGIRRCLITRLRVSNER